jgi:hypothetical protein
MKKVCAFIGVTLGLLIPLTLTVGGIYVVSHFIIKYW